VGEWGLPGDVQRTGAGFVVPSAGPAMARRADPPPEPRRIDPRNRVALTSEALQALDVGPGDYVTLVVDEGGVRLVKLHITLAPPRRPHG